MYSPTQILLLSGITRQLEWQHSCYFKVPESFWPPRIIFFLPWLTWFNLLEQVLQGTSWQSLGVVSWGPKSLIVSHSNLTFDYHFNGNKIKNQKLFSLHIWEELLTFLWPTFCGPVLTLGTSSHATGYNFVGEQRIGPLGASLCKHGSCFICLFICLGPGLSCGLVNFPRNGSSDLLRGGHEQYPGSSTQEASAI